MNPILYISVFFLSFLAGCSTTDKSLPDQPTVDHVELPKFMGRWFVIASIPTSFETDAVNATETYTWNAEAERIDIDFRYRKEKPDGEEKSVPQKAWVENTQTNAEWRVRPFWPLKFAYLIVDLAPDYSDTIVGRPGRENVWIMAREPRMSEVRYRQLLRKVEGFGYDMSKLKKVRQEWSPPSP